MGVPAELMPEAGAYLRIIGVGMPLQAIHLTFVAFFRAHGLTQPDDVHLDRHEPV